MVSGQGPECELREGREYAIAQVCLPTGVAAFAANAPREFVRAMVLAALDEAQKVKR